MTCKQCGENNLDNASFCRRCGARLQAAEEAAGGPAPTSGYTPPAPAAPDAAPGYTPPGTAAPASAYTPPAPAAPAAAPGYTPPGAAAPASAYTPPVPAAPGAAPGYTPPGTAAPASAYTPPAPAAPAATPGYTPPGAAAPASAYTPPAPAYTPPAPAAPGAAPAYTAPGAYGAAAAVPPEPAKKKPATKVLVLAGAGAVLLILLVVLLVALLGGGGSGGGAGTWAPTNGFYFVGDEYGDETFIMQNDSRVGGSIPDSVNFSRRCFDGSAVLALTENDSELYMVTNSGILLIGEYVSNAYIASSGKGAVFIDEDYVLFYCDLGSGKVTEVDTDVSRFAISPDGKTVAYTNDDDVLYLYTPGGEKQRIARDRSVLAVSNGGKYVWANDRVEGELYLYEGDESYRLSKDFEDRYDSMFNRDQTEILYASGGRWYYCKAGGEPQRLHNGDNLYLLAPAFASMHLGQRYYSYPVDSLVNMVYRSAMIGSGDLYYLSADKAGAVSSTRIARDTEAPRITANLKTLYFLKNNRLYRQPVGADTESESILSKVQGYVMSPDGNHIYYINHDDELYYVEAKKAGDVDGVLLGQDVVQASVTTEGKLFFLVDYSSRHQTGTFYSCLPGKDPVRIMEDVSYFSVSSTAVYCFANYDADSGLADLYTSNGGDSFTEIITGVQVL